MLVESPGTSTPFGGQLRALRERAGWTQEELAERAALSPHGISALERGLRTRPYPHTVRSLADALDVTESERAALIAAVPRRRKEPADGSRHPGSPATTFASARLVVPPTRIHGRDADVAAVAELVRTRAARLITLTGLGGVGKTRLLVAVSESLVDDFPDQVVSVALASLRDATSVMPAIGRSLGLPVGDGPEATDVIAAQVGPRRLLLVLDNFEHLLAAGPEVGSLMSTCPELTILVSSRAPLRVRGEHEYPVAPLSLPSPEVATTSELATSAAGALVLDRLRDLPSHRNLGAEDARLLGVLCRRLAGLPLALELAAAHLRLLTPTALLQRLGAVMASPGARDLPARQQTLRATLDWSHGLLSPEQQALFRMLGAFRGGAALSEVESVASASGLLATEHVLPLLEGLSEHSIVEVLPDPDGLPRVVMLEPVAVYARSLLSGDEAARIHRAHARVYLRLAELAALGYEQGRQLWWLARTAADEANLLVAVDRSLEGGDGETAGRLTWAMWLYWWLRAQVHVGRRQAERCLLADLPPRVGARVHLAAATMSYAAGDLPTSAAHWGEAVRLGHEEHDPEVACKGVAGLGLAALGAGDLAGATAHFRAALPSCVEAGTAGIWMRSLIHVWLGTVLLQQGNTSGAVSEIERGLVSARARGDRLTTYVALYNLAGAAVAAGDTPQARAFLEEGIRLSDQTRDKANLAYFLDKFAVVESRDDAPARVATLLGAAQSLREEVGVAVYGYYLPDEAQLSAAAQVARDALGVDAYDDGVDRGRALHAAAAAQFALSR